MPSQITYVISTRFTNGQGYVVESRRGGGGSIRIKRVAYSTPAMYLMHAVNALSPQLTQREAQVLLQNLLDYDILDQETANLILAAVSNKALTGR